MRVNILVPVDVYDASSLGDARNLLRRSACLIEHDSDDELSERIVSSLIDASENATRTSESFPTPEDIERERLAIIEPDVVSLLAKCKESLIDGVATVPCGNVDKMVRLEVQRRVHASGWTATFDEDARGDVSSVTVVPGVVTS